MQSPENIQPLKKVELSFQAGSEPGKTDLSESPVVFVFIHGVASDGLSPFESALYGKHEGDSFDVHVKSAALHEYFGHICHGLFQVLRLPMALNTVSLTVRVLAVTDAEDREIVKATAQALSHGGCGGSCGCGCS